LLSAALVAVTEQVPVPLVNVIVVPVAEHAPLPANVTVPLPLPPIDPTVKFAPKAWAIAGTPVTVSADCVAKAALTVEAAEVTDE
jgi:hypothetical protein